MRLYIRDWPREAKKRWSLFKGQLISKCLFGTNKKIDFTAMAPQVELFSFVFWENWRHQKVISKLTDLYRMRCFDGNYSTHISCVTFSLNSYFTEIIFDTFSINPPLFNGKSHIRIVLNCLNFLARKPASFMKKFEASSEKIT